MKSGLLSRRSAECQHRSSPVFVGIAVWRNDTESSPVAEGRMAWWPGQIPPSTKQRGTAASEETKSPGCTRKGRRSASSIQRAYAPKMAAVKWVCKTSYSVPGVDLGLSEWTSAGRLFTSAQFHFRFPPVCLLPPHLISVSRPCVYFRPISFPFPGPCVYFRPISRQAITHISFLVKRV